MRYTTLAVIGLTVGLTTPMFAGDRVAFAPNWENCYRLSVYRGTDAWIEEQDAFIAECQAGNIPFGDDFPRHSWRMPRNRE